MKIGSNGVVFFFFFRKEILINTIWKWGGREEGKESERIPWRAREDISIRICGCSTIILKRAYNLRIMELDYPVSFLPSFTLRFLSIRYSLSVSPLRPPSLFIENQNSGFDYRKLCGLRSAEQSCTIVAGQRKGIFDRFEGIERLRNRRRWIYDVDGIPLKRRAFDFFLLLAIFMSLGNVLAIVVLSDIVE